MCKVNKAFRLARKESKKSNHSVYHLGCCILSKNQVISVGYNTVTKSHPLVRKFDEFRTLCAETHAIIKCKDRKKLVGSTVYIYREDKRGKPKMAKSCPICLQILKLFKVKQICYTTDNGYRLESI